MQLDKMETALMVDAISEYWHNAIRHSKNPKIREKYKAIVTDFKAIQSTNAKTFTITLKT